MSIYTQLKKLGMRECGIYKWEQNQWEKVSVKHGNVRLGRKMAVEQEDQRLTSSHKQRNNDLNMAKINRKTERTNYITKGREEATLKRYEVWCDLGEKWITGAVKGRELWSQRRARDRGPHRGTHQENISPKPLAWKIRVTELCEFLQPVRLKAWSFKCQQSWLG